MSQALIETLRCNIGRTVTIFTTSGGLSGSLYSNRVFFLWQLLFPAYAIIFLR